jgi:protein phosphatase 1G
MGNYMSKPSTHKKTQFGESLKVSFASSEMQGWRMSMEDSKVINLSLDENTMIFAVFDGHGGGEVAKFVSRHFCALLLKNRFFEAGDLENALVSTFVLIDEVLRNEESIKELIRIRDGLPNNCLVKEPKMDMYVGCTALVVLIRNRRMFVANAGDCRCVLSRSKRAIDLSQDHKPTLRKEKQRILQAGGQVSEGRINRGLNLSRSLGDFIYKNNFSLPSDKQMVIPNPDVLTIDLQPTDDFFIIACDGIWESLSSQDCVDFISTNDSPLSKVAESLLEKCLSPKPNQRTGCDNMTVILVQLKESFFL